MTARIVADVLMKTDGVTRGVSQVQGKLRGLASSTGSIFKGALGAGAVLGIVDKVAGALGKIPGKVGEIKEAGSALQQSSGAVSAVFGRYTSDVEKQAKAAEQGLGLSQNAYKELASVLGAGFKNKGIKDFSGATRESIKLGGDLAAQFGGPTSDAVEAISSLMRGETDPIERYGVSINETAISAELAARGQDKLTGKALETAKAHARLGLLFRQTKDAQGAFAREAGSLAGIEQRNAAAMENLKAKLGTSLLPVFTAGANLISTRVIPVLDKVVTWAGANLPGALATAKTALLPVFSAVQSFATQVGPLLSKAFSGGGGLQGFLTQIAPLGAALAGVFTSIKALVSAVLPIIIQVFTTVIGQVRASIPQLISAYQAIASIVTSVASIITSVWAAIGPIVLPIVKSVFGTIIAVISGALNIVAGIFKVIAAVMKGDWSGAWDGIKQITSGALTIIKAVVSNGIAVVGAAIRGFIPAAKAGFATAWNGAKAATSAAWNGIKSLVSSAVSSVMSTVRSKLSATLATVRSAWNLVRSATTQAWARIKSAVTTGVSNVVTTIRGLPGKARAAISSASLFSAGARLIGTLVSGVKDKIGAAVQAVRDGLAKIKNLLPGSPIKDGPLKSWNNGGAGKRLMGLLASGIRDGSGGVQREMEAALQPPQVSLSGLLSDASTASRAATAGGATTYVTVKIDAPVGASGVDIGRELVGYLRQYGSATGQRLVIG